MQTTICAYLVSSECVRMCRQLTIIAESLPARETFTVSWKRSKEAQEHPESGYASLTKERNPVSDKSCQLTEQAGKYKVRTENTKSYRENKDKKEGSAELRKRKDVAKN